MGAAVMTPDPLFKVYCGIVTSKDAANKISDSALPKLAGSVIGKDDKLYVSTFSVPSRTFNLTGDKAHVELMQQAFSKIDNALGSRQVIGIRFTWVNSLKLILVPWKRTQL